LDRWVGKIIGTALLLSISIGNIIAQNIIHKSEFWSRVQVMNRLSPQWTIGIDFQYRRQEDSHHLMDVPLLLSYRTWVNYRLPLNFQIITNPVMYIEHTRLHENQDLNNGEPFNKVHELRTVYGVQHGLDLNKLEVRNRVLTEFRWMNFDKKESSFRFRWRYQFLINVLLTRLSQHSTMHVQVFDEVFFQPESITYPNTGITFQRMFDQNRVSLSLLTRIRVAELQLGFQYTYQLSGLRIFHKYQLLTGLLIRI
jgi:hypothetical protein